MHHCSFPTIVRYSCFCYCSPLLLFYFILFFLLRLSVCSRALSLSLSLSLCSPVPSSLSSPLSLSLSSFDLCPPPSLSIFLRTTLLLLLFACYRYHLVLVPPHANRPSISLSYHPSSRMCVNTHTSAPQSSFSIPQLRTPVLKHTPPELPMYMYIPY
ncbi:hypothetical protein BP00DRAFT_178185 [Aspergillus indologenus CBS 114.80]|uniref:Uncharacterized protein n=1 Tax=Aspergillus indologenus CBS 114.80 TaxID=1450541 RepID=A0A2V5J8Z3_9EURO|nr:hypothetical protein BP00DRAFT_178185 [Aspergillus indologenus CBS 114.80]